MAGWRLALARLSLAWERIWPAFWPVTALMLLLLVLAAFDLLPLLPGWLHALVLATLFAGMAISGVRAVRGLRLPDRPAALRRLERDSGLAHRPLQALEDRLATADDDALSRALWAAHRDRMATSVRRLRLGWPRAGLLERDPYAVRAVLGILLLLGILSAGNDFWPRLERALSPDFEAAAAQTAAGYDLWITPPDYTGLPPAYFGSAVAVALPSAAKPLPVPAGSTVLARVHGGAGVPKLSLGRGSTPFAALGPDEYSVKAPLGDARRLAIRQGGLVLAQLAMSVVPDQPPTAEWTGKPQVTPRGALRLDYAAEDDYGVKSLALEVRRDGGSEPPLQIPIAVPGRSKEIKASTFQDLTSSLWAGLPVEMRLIARDAIEQQGMSAPLKLVLPERVFRNPVAKAIAEQRKILIRDPSQADVVAETLDDLAERPELFRNDLTVFLALRTAVARLDLDASHQSIGPIAQLMWDTALRIEDGAVPEAEKSLREAEQALQDALDHNASDKEIEALMRDLEQAVQRYLQAMMANASPDQQTPQGSQQSAISPEDIQKMLQDAHDMARTGARDAAKQALANLQNLLESLRVGQAPGQAGPEQKALQAMQGLAEKQRQLLDRSFRAAQKHRDDNGRMQGGQGTDGRMGQSRSTGGEDGELANAQEALRRQLGEAMRQMGENGGIPDAAGRAERAMRGAADALRRGEPGDATGQQGEALDQLQQAMREMAEKMSQGQGNGPPQESGRDPFGRTGSGAIDNGDVKLPTEVDMQRSREILDELRRRSAERSRPALERDYINRLLQRF